MKKHLGVPIHFGLTVVALIHILMDVFANNLLFREKRGKKSLKRGILKEKRKKR